MKFQNSSDISTNICVALLLGVILFVLYLTIEKRDYPENQHRKVETNSIGCERWKYNNDYYWKCPKELGLSSIENRVGKKTKLEPVVSE